MVSRISREEEIRLAMVCADPLAIKPDSSGHIQDWQSIAISFFIFENVDQGLPPFRLRFGMLLLISLDVELDLVRAAPSRCTSRRCPILRKCRQCQQSKEKQCTYVLHFVTDWRPFGPTCYRIRKEALRTKV